MLTKKYASVNFLPLQGFQDDWEATTTIQDDWNRMTSACLLHFNGDVAAMVRWIGGPHVNTHLNPTAILAKLQPIVDDDIYQDVARILTRGAPAFCNASASESNFQDFRTYRNHSSVEDNHNVFESTIVKQSKRGLTLIMDPSLIHFTLNAHLSPKGLVDVIHHRRKPRPLSDSSVRPRQENSAINDWTNKANEPSLHFAASFLKFCVWQWNLAITYLNEDRYTGDDDVQCAFPRIKYNPNLVAMHSAISNDTLIMNTGLTFGDNTSPSNWEPIARARQQLAQSLWHQAEATIENAKPYLPPFKFDPPATSKSPTYNHHVDNNMYADVETFLPATVSASIVALYEILGHPDKRLPDPVSWDKFQNSYGHIRRVVGWEFNTRTLSFALSADKCHAITESLYVWKSKKSCTLLEAASLHGMLADASRANQRGRTLFFGLQNALRRAIQTRYHQVRGFYDRKWKTHDLTANLPKYLFSQIESLIARDMATLIWRSKIAIPVTEAIRFELNALREAFANTDIPWSISIGHIILRDPQMTSLGDACGTGGGAYSHDLRYWFNVVWSQAKCKLFMSRKVHINVLEFVIVILQLAAAITRETETGTPLRTFQPLEKLLIRCGNSPPGNWAHKNPIHRSVLAIADKNNTLTDLLSRPPTHTLHSRLSPGPDISERAAEATSGNPVDLRA